MEISELYKFFLQSNGVETDTRNLKPGFLFFALKGDNFNGNNFLEQALEMGATYCIADEAAKTIKSDKVIWVDNSLETLQQLAKHHRRQFDIPLLAITGSNGKTTTKELVHAALSTSFKTYTTEGNLNNHIGIPITLLRIKKDAEMAIVEMGANHQKEIAGYCEYTLPTHGLITNCGKAHLEGFGGLEGVIKGKTELYKWLSVNDGSIFINNDLDYLKPFAALVKKQVSYGTTHADYTGEIQDNRHYLEVKITKGAGIDTINTQLVGSYNSPNILAALAVAKTFGVKDDDIKAALENYTPTNSRSQWIKRNGNDIVLDAYNANPTSMELAIRNFASMEGEKKILILGSMMELGENSDDEHEGIIHVIQEYKWDAVAICGSGYKQIPAGMLNFSDATEAGKWFSIQGFENYQVLIKGSRSMQMEKVLC